MKTKKRYLAITLLLIFSILLSSCSFVSYIKYTEEQPRELTFDETLDLYLSKIEMLASASIYNQNVYAEYKSFILDAENELNECSSIEELNSVFDKHIYQIIDYALKSHLIFDDYREEEQQELLEIIEKYTKGIVEASSVSHINDLFSLFQSEYKEILTNDDLLKIELAELKNSLPDDIKNIPIYTDYADKELEDLDSLIKEFDTKLEKTATVTEALSLFNSYKSKILSVPTIKALVLNNKNSAIEEWKVRFSAFKNAHSLSADTAFNSLILEMKALSTAQQVNLKGSELLISKSIELGTSAIVDMRNNAKLYLQNLILEVDYCQEQVSEFNTILSSAFNSFDDCSTVTEIYNKLNVAKQEILSLQTSDSIWAQKDTDFFNEYLSDYGTKGLAIPAKTAEAATYEELAAIIDFYAFHQTSNSSFLRDTFRVKILFPHRNAQWEINEVYWYCELIRSAVGITATLERTSTGDYLVITLVPYALSTQTNADPSPVVVERLESQVEYKSESNYSPRPNDFENFGYLTKHTKTISGIWNTQQLWYALEHGYIPEVVSGSAAERTLERAKELLRELILDGMSDEEKIYSIFTWFSKNVIFDDDYTKYLYPEDRDHFPDELAATLNAFHAEGALFDNLAVCEGFAKAMLILLRVEGIESYRIFIHGYSTNAINNLGVDGYGSHALVAIKMSDGKFYISDTYEAYQHNTPYPKLHQFLIPWDFHTTFIGSWSRIFTDFVYGTTVLPSIMENLVYNDISIFNYTEQELDIILDSFKNDTRMNICVSVFNYDILEKNFDVFEKIKASGINYYKISYKGLDEYILYK